MNQINKTNIHINKTNIHRILYALSLILLCIFIIVVVIDYINYDAILNSAPFSAFVLIRALEFLLPCLVSAVAAWICQRKWRK